MGELTRDELRIALNDQKDTLVSAIADPIDRLAGEIRQLAKRSGPATSTERFSAATILVLMGALAAFGAFALRSTIDDLDEAEERIYQIETRFGDWTTRVLPLDAAQSKSIAETDRIQEMMWNRQFPNEPYPRMRTPAPVVKP